MKPLPHDARAEKTVIGFMVFGSHMHAILSELDPSDFYVTAHRVIAETCIDLFRDGDPVDALTVSERLERNGRLASVGGREYIGACVGLAFSDDLLDGAITIVKDAALLRHGYAATVTASNRFANPTERATELINELQTNLLNLAARNNVTKTIDSNMALSQAFSHLDSDNRAKNDGIMTGYVDLDYRTGGLQRGELIILAARPSMGKTSLMLNISANVAMSGLKVYICTLEMTAKALSWRLLFSEAEVNMHLGKTGEIHQPRYVDELKRTHDAYSGLQNLPIWYNQSSFNIMEICSMVQRESATHGIDLLCLDYLGLAHSGLRGVSRNDEIGFMTGNLKRLAKELNIPVLCLSQLSRINENQAIKEPTLNALRDSGNIEQDADTVLFIHSNDYYSRKTEGIPDEWEASVIIAKQRNGPTGVVNMTYCRQFTRFFGTHKQDRKKRVLVPDWYESN